MTMSAHKEKLPHRHWRVTKVLNRFRRSTKGTAAIEFAFIAPPFLMLLFSLFEIGLTYAADIVLQNALNETARMIRTGQPLTQAQFRQNVCDKISIILACDSKLAIDVRTYSSFSTATLPSPLDASENFRTDFKYETGGKSAIVVARVFYAWKPVTPYLGRALVNMSGDARLLQGVAVFRNEPF
jgi:Flp pilus assembly protein TadG